MKTRKFKVNLKSCAGTFFYSHVVLIFGGLFFFCFIFMMDERKKYCQPGVYVLCFCFSYFIGPLMILSKLSGASLLQKSLARAHLSASLTPCILIYRMVGYYFFQVNTTSYLVIFGPWRSCLGHIQPAFWCSVGSILHAGLTKWRNGLDACGMIQPSGDCTLGFFLELCSAALKLRRVQRLPAVRLGQTPVCLAFRHQHSSSCPSSASALSPNLHLLSASLTYPALSAALPCHLQSQLMCCSEETPRYREMERCPGMSLVALLICCQFFSFPRLLLLRTRAVLFVSVSCSHIEDTDSRL